MTLPLAVVLPCVAARSLQPVLKLRGGAALLGVPPSPVATAASSLGLISGIYCSLAPTAACMHYGLGAPSAATARMCRFLGVTNVAQGTLGLAALTGTRAHWAIAMGQFPLLWITAVETIVQLAHNREAGEGGGTSRTPLFFALTLGLATATCGFRDAFMPLAAIFGGGWLLLLCGLPASLMPRWVAGKLLHSHEDEADDAAWRGMLQNVGTQMSSFAVLQVLIAMGISASRAIGYSWAVALLGLLNMAFITRAHDAMGVRKEDTVLPWLLVQPAVVALTLW